MPLAMKEVAPSTETPTATATRTGIPATSTLTPTRTLTATATATSILTVTPTRTATATRTRTATPSLGIPTPTLTRTGTATRTPTSTATRTGIPATSTLTPTHTRTATATRTPTQTATQATGIVNGDFEQWPAVGWTLYSSTGHTGLIGTGDFFDSPDITPRVDPHSGIYMARLGGFNYEINEIYQTVTLPNSTPLYLTFYYQIRGAAGTECTALDGGEIKIYIGSQMAYDAYICDDINTPDWTRGAIDLSAIPGQTVQIIFHMEAAGSGWWTYVYLDDIALGPTP